MTAQFTTVGPAAIGDSATPETPSINLHMAGKLRDCADLLVSQGEGGFRSRAYRRAADVIAALDRPVDEILARQGRAGLIALPAVGVGIACAIAEMVTTGRWSQMDRLWRIWNMRCISAIWQSRASAPAASA